MAFNNIISRSDVDALLPEATSNELLENLPGESAALNLFRRIPMPTNTLRFPVLSALPVAYFVGGDTGLKQTTEIAWANKFMQTEEIATIVPIPEAVLDDAGFDVWGQVRPNLETAIGRTLDAAVFFGVNKPGTWPAAIVPGAIAAGNTVARGTASQAEGGVAEDLNRLFAAIEADGFDVNGLVGQRTFRSILRGARDANGQRLLDISNESVEGVGLRYAMPGLWPTGTGSAELLAGDFTQGIIGVRSDFTYKLLDQAVITDDTGAIIFNLPQQDMVALRVVFRVAFQVANTMTWENATEASRYPFAVLTRP